jgi:hypothetical protein
VVGLGSEVAMLTWTEHRALGRDVWCRSHMNMEMALLPRSD